MTGTTPLTPSNASCDAAPYRAVAVGAGVVSILGMVVGAFAISPINDIGNPDALERGLAGVAAHPASAITAGWVISVALVAGVVLLWMLARISPSRSTALQMLGALLVTAGGLANLVGLIGLVALAHALTPLGANDPSLHAASLSIVAVGLSLDAAYNLFLGFGLVALGAGIWRAGWPRPLAWLAIAAGVSTLPSALEWYSNVAGQAQYVGEGLILVWQVGVTAWLWRGGKASERPHHHAFTVAASTAPLA